MTSSILEEKLVFKDKKYRTPIFKEAFGYIYNKINALQDIKEKTGNNLSKVSLYLHLSSGMSNSLHEELDDFLKLFKQKNN
ncbi:MAG: hypothetical protein RL259_7 [Bacteroidota bacterium]|jgi:hypothetical protein